MEELSQHNQTNNNFPSQITRDGIRQLFTNNMANHTHEYIFQIIKIIQDYSNNRLCHLSDGSCYVTAELTDQARLKNIKGQLEVFDIVKVRKQDVRILGLQKNPSLQLRNIHILGMRVLCTIGQPVAYMTYFHNDFVNRKSSTLIADGQRIQNSITINQLLQNYPHVPTKWILRAKVVRKPDNINTQKPFMIVRLMDQKQNIIQGVFFGQVALDAHRKLVYNHEYLFNNGQIKSKKNSTDQFQIKFTQQSQIIPIQTMKSSLNQNNNNNINTSHHINKIQQGQLTISDITNNINGNDNKLVTITGKVYKLKNLSKGRCLQVIDKNSDVIEIVIWEQIKDQVKEGITYIFQNLRTKQYNSSISLQSVRFKTTVKKAPYQIQRQSNVTNSRRIQQKATPFSRQLKEPTLLSSVTQIAQLNIQTKQYKNIYGFLTINTMYMDTKNFFKVQCPNCIGNNQQISSNPLMCRKCSCTTPSIRWNLRCHIIDEKQDIKCTMNEQLCQRLFKMSSLQGFKKLNQDKQYIRRKAQQISHVEGMYKIKINPTKDNTYYNIVDVYKNDSSVLLKKIYQDLKQTLKKSIALHS